MTIASGPAECDLAYGNDAAYSIILIADSGERSDPASVSVGEDGSFSAELPVPESFPAGNASAVVTGSPHDDCTDDSASCALYAVDFTVEVGDDAP